MDFVPGRVLVVCWFHSCVPPLMHFSHPAFSAVVLILIIPDRSLYGDQMVYYPEMELKTT